MKRITHNQVNKVIPYRKPNRTPNRYPNAADRRYYIDRLTDILLSAATACGAVPILAFLFVMS